jgi:hypothetical protein
MTNYKWFLHWTPRILSVLAILFVSLFALDAFSPELSIWQQIGAFTLHMVPSFILLTILLVAIKWESIGGWIFLMIGLGFSPFIFTHNYNMNNSVWISLGIVAMINLPFIVVGALFILDAREIKKRSLV